MSTVIYLLRIKRHFHVKHLERGQKGSFSKAVDCKGRAEEVLITEME